MMADHELETLIHRYLDGVITAGEMAQLNARLCVEAGARREFAELLNLDSALAEVAAGASVEEVELEAASPARMNAVPFPVAARWRALAACVAFVAVGLWWFVPRQPYATVAGGVGSELLAVGAALRGEAQELKTGTLEMITARGARVVIEAPAAFRFESAQKLRLLHGRLAADVPSQAKGFTVITPTGKAVDLGTKFGVDVPQSGEAEIHVFQGEVIAQSSGGRRQSLRGGEAYSLQTGAGAARELRSSAFIRPEEVASLHAALNAGQHTRSDSALAKLRNDPALIALLDFESDAAAEGAYRTAQGRWPGSRAPEFVSVGDHMKLDVGGERAWPQLTLAAWVRLDRLGAPYQSLLHTDGWSKDNPGQVHWMVTRHTTMRLALISNTLAPGSDEREQYPDSHTSVLPEQGRWVHLATVYDSVKRTVRFYLNGQFDKETRQEIAHPARLGPAQIGNWDKKDRKLSGRIDELVLLGRAMNDDEIRALFDAGNPYR
jgi:hypothetical protein